MTLKRTLAMAVAVKLALVALAAAGALALYVSDVPPSFQHTLVRLYAAIVLVSPLVAAAAAAVMGWRAIPTSTPAARISRALLGAGLAGTILLFPLPGTFWPTFFDTPRASLAWRLWEAPRGECDGDSSCPQDQRCVRERGARTYRCVERPLSACVTQDDCPAQQTCACACSPPLQQGQQGNRCVAACLPEAVAATLPPIETCSATLAARREPAPQAAPEPIHISWPARTGPPRPLRLLAVWKPGEGWVAIGDQLDAWLSNRPAPLAVPLATDTLPLDVIDGYLFLVSGRYRLTHGAPGFTFDQQRVETVELAAALSQSPAFREAFAVFERRLLDLAPNDWGRGVLQPELLGELPTEALLARLAELIDAGVVERTNGIGFLRALVRAAARRTSLLDGHVADLRPPVEKAVAALREPKRNGALRVALECRILARCQALPGLVAEAEQGRSATIMALDAHGLLDSRLLAPLLAGGAAGPSAAPGHGPLLAASVIGRASVPTFPPPFAQGQPLSVETRLAGHAEPDSSGAVWILALGGNGGVVDLPLAVQGHAVRDMRRPDAIALTLLVANVAYEPAMVRRVTVTLVSDGAAGDNMVIEAPATVATRSVYRLHQTWTPPAPDLGEEPRVRFDVAVEGKQFRLEVPLSVRPVPQ